MATVASGVAGGPGTGIFGFWCEKLVVRNDECPRPTWQRLTFPSTIDVTLGIIKRSVASMDRMIQDVLDIAGIESGRLKVVTKVVPAASILENAVEILGPGVADKAITLDCSFQQLPQIWADPDRTLLIQSAALAHWSAFGPDAALGGVPVPTIPA